MGHEEKDAGHDIKEEVTSDAAASHSQQQKHRIKSGNEKRGLDKVQEQADDSIAVALPDVPHHAVKDQLAHFEGVDELASFSLGLKHFLKVWPL